MKGACKHGYSDADQAKQELGQQQLFITDENSALTWIFQFLDKSHTYGDIYTSYNKMVIQVEDEIPELKELLNSNFIFEDKCYRRPRSTKEQELVEAQRERELDRAFDKLLLEARASTKRLKNVRKEALKQGFTRAYQESRFAQILEVAKKLDKKILEENSELNDFVEIARIKMGEE